mmetsp:Transcript_9386/g.16330  ORF Transcript_9386/g.16330 Transcript_9386/m.16330 type:complete len:239 (+) Transcript_9386:382-1098(+)
MDVVVAQTLREEIIGRVQIGILHIGNNHRLLLGALTGFGSPRLEFGTGDAIGGYAGAAGGVFYLLLQFLLGKLPSNHQTNNPKRNPHPHQNHLTNGNFAFFFVQHALGTRPQYHQQHLPRQYPHHGQNKRRPFHAGNTKYIIEHTERYQRIQTQQHHHPQRIPNHRRIHRLNQRIPLHQHHDQIARHVLGTIKSDHAPERAPQKAGHDGNQNTRVISVRALKDEPRSEYQYRGGDENE